MKQASACCVPYVVDNMKSVERSWTPLIEKEKLKGIDRLVSGG